MQVMPGDDERQHQRRAGLVVRRHAGQHEDAGADDRADAKARELDRSEHPPQPLFAVHFIEQRLSGFRANRFDNRCLPTQAVGPERSTLPTRV